jgi:hypothetical protein
MTQADTIHTSVALSIRPLTEDEAMALRKCFHAEWIGVTGWRKMIVLSGGKVERVDMATMATERPGKP